MVVVEHHHDHDDSSASSMLVAVVAIVAILVVGFFIVRMLQAQSLVPANNGSTMDINVKGVVPSPTNGNTGQGTTKY